MAKLSNSRTPGLDETPGEIIKIGKRHLVPFFTKRFSAICDRQDFPEEWRRLFIIPIYKSGNSLDPKNYIGTSLLSVISKLFSSILTNRLQNWVEKNQQKRIKAGRFSEGSYPHITCSDNEICLRQWERTFLCCIHWFWKRVQCRLSVSLESSCKIKYLNKTHWNVGVNVWQSASMC